MNKMNFSRKTFVVALFALFSTGSLLSQDLVEMMNGDSINCTIQVIEDQFVRITYPRDEAKSGSTISRDQVKSIKFGYYKVREPKGNSIFSGISHWRVAVRGGYSRGIGALNVIDAPSEYNKGLLNGYHIGVDGGYFFSDFIGVGARFNYYKNGNEGTMFVEDKETMISDDIRSFYIGPQLMARFKDKSKKNALFAHASIGYLEYRNKYFEEPIDHKFRSGVFGADLGVAYERVLTGNLSLGAGFSAFFGRMSSVKDSYYDKDGIYQTDNKSFPTRNLSRLNFSLYLVFDSGD